MNFRMIAYVLGWILVFESLFMAAPLITAVCFGETEFWHFLLSAGLCLLIGRLMIRKKPERSQLYSREGNVIVALSWILLSIFGAIPFYISGAAPSYLDALFETVSGFTTTGASILSEVESMPRSMLMWRSFTHWVGGMGVLVFIMAFLPLSGAQNIHIMKAESPGPSVSKLVPRVKSTALILYGIYFVLTLLEFVALLICDMSVFDAMNTAFATAGTGGFGVRNDSMGSFSPAVQIVVTVFMILFSINFNSYFLLICRKFRDAFNTEVCVFLLTVAAVTGIIAFNIRGLFDTAGEAVRHSAFAVSSLISTTGFGTVDFNLWPELSRTLLVMVMFIGACAGSTGGGIKVSRIVILFKSMHKELLAIIHPKQVKKIKLNSHPIEHDVVRGVNVFMVAYLMTYIISLILISFDNHDLITNFTAVAAAINNIGPGLELVGPTSNFGFFSAPAKAVLIFDMLAGRLELFPMLLLFTPSTWKK